MHTTVSSEASIVGAGRPGILRSVDVRVGLRTRRRERRGRRRRGVGLCISVETGAGTTTGVSSAARATSAPPHRPMPHSGENEQANRIADRCSSVLRRRLVKGDAVADDPDVVFAHDPHP